MCVFVEQINAAIFWASNQNLIFMKQLLKAMLPNQKSKPFFFLCLIFISHVLWAQPSGSGTINDPYEISDLEDLRYLAENSALWAAGIYFEQTANIDASETSSWNGGSGFKPIGNSGTQFRGNYNGNGHTISNLYISRSSSDYVGLFGYIYGGTIESLSISDCNITGREITGGLSGRIYAASTVTNCYVTGTITGYNSTGGLLGQNYNSTVSESYAICTVNGNNNVGGLIGYEEGSGEVTKCFASVDVNGGYGSIGGLVGYNYNCPIRQCYTAGTVTGGSSAGAGGLAGLSKGTSAVIENCYSTADVDGGNTSVAGFVGQFKDGASISNCYCTGSVTTTSTSNIGGFVGPIVAGIVRGWSWEYVFIASLALPIFFPLLVIRGSGNS